MESLNSELVMLLIFVGILFVFYLGRDTPKRIGERGERAVINLLERQLPDNLYYCFHDVTLPSSHGDTQIDHLIISRYGIFVIETKNYSDWIFGSESVSK